MFALCIDAFLSFTETLRGYYFLASNFYWMNMKNAEKMVTMGI